MKHTKIFFVLFLMGTFFLQSVPEAGADTSIYGRIDTSIRYDAGWNYNSELSASQPVSDLFEDNRLNKWMDKMPPSRVLLTDGLWNKNSLFAKPYSRLLFDKQLFQDEISDILF